MHLKPPALRRRLSFLIVWSVLAAACGGGGSGVESPLRFALTGNDSLAATLRLEGVPSDVLRSATNLAPEWSEAFRVTVAGGDGTALPAVAGVYSVDGDAIVFKPTFGFDPGRQYRAEFEPARLGAATGEWSPAPLVVVVGLPAKPLSAPTTVAQVYPSGDVVPENQLRLYIHFSAPMGRKGGLEYVRLLDDRGEAVTDPFLPLDAEFWNGDRTRYTVFFDPGRQKRGILPNEEMGRSLVLGKSYTLMVSRDWLDAEGQPLAAEFRRQFLVGPADERPLAAPATWRVTPPASGTRDPLVVAFDESLDHGLLMRAVGVVTDAGAEVPGAISVADRETRWSFVPAEPWRAAPYRLKVLSFLEDLAGNRIGRAFELDNFERADRQPEPEAFTVAWRPASAAAEGVGGR